MKTNACLAAFGLILVACSQFGSFSGDVIVQTPPGETNPGAHVSVTVIRSTETFTHDWATALSAYQTEVEPARKAQQAAAANLEEARLEWDQALAARRTSGVSRRFRGTLASARVRQLWEQLRAAEHVLFKAERRVWEVARRHDGQADSLIANHALQRVQTDGNGHYVLAGLPTGKNFLYARVLVRDQTLVWFLPVLVRSGAQRLDLTEANRGGWPFTP